MFFKLFSYLHHWLPTQHRQSLCFPHQLTLANICFIFDMISSPGVVFIFASWYFFLFSFPFFHSFLSLCFMLLTNKITNNISPLCLLLSKWVFWSIHNSCLQPPANLFSKCSNDLYKMYQLDYYLSRLVNIENSGNQ